MHAIICRYEYWGPDGIAWTRWFVYKNKIDKKSDGEKDLAELMENAKKDKLKQEYKLVKENEINKILYENAE